MGETLSPIWGPPLFREGEARIGVDSTTGVGLCESLWEVVSDDQPTLHSRLLP